MGLTIALVAGCSGSESGAGNSTRFVQVKPGYSEVSLTKRKPAPDLSGSTLTNSKLALSSLRGKVVVVNFWGSWCAPCRAEAPDLSTLASRYRSLGVRFLGIDIQDEPASAEAFMQTFRITYPSLNDPGDEIALAFRKTVPPNAIPTTLVIDRSGHIAARIVGGATYDALKALIARVLGSHAVAAGASQ